MSNQTGNVPVEEQPPAPTGIAVPALDRDPVLPPNSNSNQPRTFTEEELHRAQEEARRQEKDKLYEKLGSTEQTLAELKADLDARKAAEAEALRQAQVAEEARKREELSAKDLLDQQAATWENRFAEMQKELAQRDALLLRESEFQALATTRQRMLDEEGVRDSIAPQLLDYVGGGNEAEIAQSIAMAQKKTADILAEVQGAQQRQRQQMKGPSVTQPPVGPMETDQAYETLTPEDIASMSMTEYGKHRDKLLAAASRAARQGAQ
jgi:hypothetical protein